MRRIEVSLAKVLLLLLALPWVGTLLIVDSGLTWMARASAVEFTTPTCLETATLEELITCIVGQMPGRDSEGFVVPTSTEQSDWRSVIAQMLSDQCDDINLPASLSGIYSVGTFNDAGNGQSYCALIEILDEDGNGKVDRGWGTFILNPNPSRELSIHIAHPIADSRTEDQGIDVFKGTNSRSFLMAGTHRDANSTLSACQPSEVEADVAHNVANMFQPTVQDLLNFYEAIGVEFVAIQFHGHAPSSCPGLDVYLTYGRPTPPSPGDKLLELQSNLLAHNPDWTVTVPGDTPSCTLHGSTNVQGRLLNGVAAENVCTIAASSYSGRFIHIEQKAGFRNAGDWVGAINDTWPAASTVSLSVTPPTIPPGGTLTATWSGIAAPTPTDWLGLYVPGADNAELLAWRYTTGDASGSVPFELPGTLAPGTYELRLLANDGFTLLATSDAFTVTEEHYC